MLKNALLDDYEEHSKPYKLKVKYIWVFLCDITYVSQNARALSKSVENPNENPKLHSEPSSAHNPNTKHEQNVKFLLILTD